ncbi:thioesterase II family protein [Salibacterium sp. K-3]
MEKKTLFCLPYAGGSAESIYFSWKTQLQKCVEVVPIELPGRGKRIKESLIKSVDEMVDDIIRSIKDRINETDSYAIFGHSMGGLLAYELVRRLHTMNLKIPDEVIISGFQPPEYKVMGDYGSLSMEEFSEKIRMSGNVPSIIFENKKMYDIFMPIIHTDYQMFFSYSYKPHDDDAIIKSDLYAFTGIDDYQVYQRRNDWAYYTSGKFQSVVFEGGHFYINNNQQQVISNIRDLFLAKRE